MKHFLLSYLLVAAAAAGAGSPLFEAFRQGEGAKVRTAIENGADAHARDAQGNTLLMQAALYGSVEDVEFLVAHGTDPNAANQATHTALMRAIPHVAKMKILLEHGARIDAVTAAGNTALMMAAHSEQGADAVRLLLGKGADFRRVNNRGLDAVMIAAEYGAIANLKGLLEAGAGGDARVNQIRANLKRGNTEVGTALGETAKRRLTGITALMGAVSRVDCVECVRLLLEHGADARMTTESGVTALQKAAYMGNVATVNLLLDSGAPVNAADERGFTALMMAANSRTRDPRVVELLLDHGANVKIKDKSGRTAADWAVIGGRPQIRSLLKGGAEAKPAAVESSGGSIAQSIALLQQTGPGFFPKSGCISCHNVSIPMIALAEAHKHGHDTQAAVQQMAKHTAAFLMPNRDDLLSGYCNIPGFTVTASYALLSLHAAGYAPDSATDAVVRCLAVEQRSDGSQGLSTTERPPLAPESPIPGAALSVRAVRLYPIPALAGALDAHVSRARGYLAAVKPKTGDDYAFRLLGLHWSSAAPKQMAAAAQDLIAQQRADGGWAQTPDLGSDAYATGLSLTALSIAQPDSLAGAAYRRGVDFLSRTRHADGSWHVSSRAFGFQPYFESGFPHGQDQWISMTATAWASTALLAIEEKQVAHISPAQK